MIASLPHRRFDEDQGCPAPKGAPIDFMIGKMTIAIASGRAPARHFDADQ